MRKNSWVCIITVLAAAIWHMFTAAAAGAGSRAAWPAAAARNRQHTDSRHQHHYRCYSDRASAVVVVAAVAVAAIDDGTAAAGRSDLRNCPDAASDWAAAQCRTVSIRLEGLIAAVGVAAGESPACRGSAAAGSPDGVLADVGVAVVVEYRRPAGPLLMLLMAADDRDSGRP